MMQLVVNVVAVLLTVRNREFVRVFYAWMTSLLVNGSFNNNLPVWNCSKVDVDGLQISVRNVIRAKSVHLCSLSRRKRWNTFQK